MYTEYNLEDFRQYKSASRAKIAVPNHRNHPEGAIGAKVS